MHRYGERLDAMEARLRTIETVESGQSLLTMKAEQQRLRDRVEELQAAAQRSGPVIEQVGRVAGWIVAGLIGLAFAGVQITARAADAPPPPAGQIDRSIAATAWPMGAADGRRYYIARGPWYATRTPLFCAVSRFSESLNSRIYKHLG
jgi:hypothetical protein